MSKKDDFFDFKKGSDNIQIRRYRGEFLSNFDRKSVSSDESAAEVV